MLHVAQRHIPNLNTQFVRVSQFDEEHQVLQHRPKRYIIRDLDHAWQRLPGAHPVVGEFRDSPHIVRDQDATFLRRPGEQRCVVSPDHRRVLHTHDIQAGSWRSNALSRPLLKFSSARKLGRLVEENIGADS
jgi:hypothetical protein